MAARITSLCSAHWERARPLVVPRLGRWPFALQWVFGVGLLLLIAETAALSWWSVGLAHKHAINWDYAAYNQAIYLIAHGHLDPYSTSIPVFGSSAPGLRFLSNGGELIAYLLAVGERIYPNIGSLKLMQALALGASQLIAFIWICQALARRALDGSSRAVPIGLAVLGLVLLIGNPWTWWTVSNDAHMESFAACFLLCAAYTFARGWSRLGILATVLLMACGVAATSYALALGLSLMLSGRRWLRSGMVLVVGTLLWYAVLRVALLSHTAGSGGVADGVFSDPGGALRALWLNRTNMWATISPGGVIGLLWLPLAVPSLVVLLEGATVATNRGFALPGFQNVALVPLLAVGTVLMLAALHTWLERRSTEGSPPVSRSRMRTHTQRRNRPRLEVPIIALILVTNTMVWGVLYRPGGPYLALPAIPAKLSSALTEVRSMVQPGDAVIVDNPVSGAFSDRSGLYVLGGEQQTANITAHRVWVILTPTYGSEAMAPSLTYAYMAALAKEGSVRLMLARDGVWAYLWQPSGPLYRFPYARLGIRPEGTLPTTGWWGRIALTVPAHWFVGKAGRTVATGAPDAQHVVSTGQAGDIVANAQFPEPLGRFQVVTSISVAGREPVNIDVWDAADGKLLASRKVSPTAGKRVPIAMTVDLDRAVQGWSVGPALWQVDTAFASANDGVLSIDIHTRERVGSVKVYTVGVG